MKLTTWWFTSDRHNSGEDTQLFGSLETFNEHRRSVILEDIDAEGSVWPHDKAAAIQVVRTRFNEGDIEGAWELFRDCDGCDHPLHFEYDYFYWGKQEVEFNAPQYDEVRGLSESLVQLRTALSESVKLQSHYADLLNNYDGGDRTGFKDATAWIERLRETGTLPK